MSATVVDADANEGGPAGEQLPDAPAGTVRAVVGGELRRERRLVGAAIVATIVAAIAAAFGPVLIQRAIDDGITARDSASLRTSTLLYLLALVVAGFVSGLRTTAMTTAGERVLDRLRVRALAGALRLDLGRFERTERGNLTARVTADTEALANATLWVLPDSVRFAADLVAAFVALTLLSPVLALVTLVAVPPTVVAGRVLQKRSQVVYPAYRARNGELVGQLTETVEGAATVRAFGRRDARLELLRGGNDRVTSSFLDGTRMRNRFYASLTVTRVTATAVVLVVASLLAIEGQISVGTAAAGVLAVAGVFGPLAWLTELLDDVLAARAALLRVVGVAELPEDEGGSDELPAHADLRLRGVTFAYRSGLPVLHDVDLDVPAGARVALVGATGSGKSTIARLLAGLAHPQQGRVTYGDVDLTTAQGASRRQRIAYVPQEDFCFDGTLRENLLLVCPTASEDVVDAAVDGLGLRAWVDRHNDGLAREVGSAGSSLSAGERQLVGLLRVALTGPSVVVLDEATAALDAETEALVAGALDRVLTGRTLVVIAHRPATAQRCELIAHIEDGRVVATTSPRG